MPFNIIRQDISLMDTDAVVSCGNAGLSAQGGVSGAIFRAAGEKLPAACMKLAPINTAQAVITKGFDLKARCIIHTLGPVYSEHTPEESIRLLRLTYSNCLELAEKHCCRSIAFPLISSGQFGFPKEEALKTAVQTIGDFLSGSEMDVYLTVYGGEAFAVSRSLIGGVRSYIDQNYVEAHPGRRNRAEYSEPERSFYFIADEGPDMPDAFESRAQDES